MGNNQLHTIIKLRHLRNASQHNWEMLQNIQKMVNSFINDAQEILENYGDNSSKERFESDLKSLKNNIDRIQAHLTSFHQFINGNKTIDIKESFRDFSATLEETKIIFDTISSYPNDIFTGIGGSEWKDIWNVVKSNIYLIQGIAESAYVKSLMIENFNKLEVDTLTSEIVKHIPQSFNLIEADRYKEEYIQAVKDIERESNAKDNIWDRFLNVLAGNMPFKQTPEERVMMTRWLEGERGEL